MRNQKQHLSDKELLLAVDGELGRRAERVRAHLDACAFCRMKAAQAESVLVEWTQVERNRLDKAFRPISEARALLRTRLAEASTGKATFFARYSTWSKLLPASLGMATLATLLVMISVHVLRKSSGTSTAQLLQPAGHGILPNPALTPGAARKTSLEQVCLMPHDEVIKAVSPAEMQRVFAEYGIPTADANKYEVDYLITPGLGGDDNIRNLWPEPYGRMQWNAHAKDILEERLHEMVCRRQIDLSVAQAAIATNWIAAFQKYVQSASPQVLKTQFSPPSTWNRLRCRSNCALSSKPYFGGVRNLGQPYRIREAASVELVADCGRPRRSWEWG